MPATLSSAAPQTLKDYYRIHESGIDAYQDGAALRPLLGDHLDFTGSLAGHLPDATEGFLVGVAGFIGTVQQIEIIGDGAPGGGIGRQIERIRTAGRQMRDPQPFRQGI